MNIIKRVSAVLLIAVMAISAAGCHKKNEVAVKAGDIEFTSAYYMCVLINADAEAKSKVKEDLGDDADTSDIDYYSKKVEGKKFVNWVKDTALENIKKLAAYKSLCKENKLEIDEETKTNAETYANYYWTNYGYSNYYEPNGVSESTYKQYMLDSYYSNLYFDHLYGAEGEKAVSAEDVRTAMLENYVIADMLNASYSGKTDDEKAELKAKFEGYETALKNGTMTFEQAYKEQNSSTDDTESTDSETAQPLDKYASVLGSDKTNYTSDYYEDAKAMAVGEVKLITLDNDAGLLLMVKQDISADPYYTENLDSGARHVLKDDEFNAALNEYIKGMKIEVSKYAINQFKVKKIKEPATSSAS